MAKVTKLHDIRARVTARWKHPRCKFKRGDFAEVSAQVLPRQYVRQDGKIAPGSSYVSKYKQRRAGQVGEVLAVSCLANGKIRSNDFRYSNGGVTRMFTRYYIQFSDGEILGYESHHLKPAFDLRNPR
jgi:hypothetical protein